MNNTFTTNLGFDIFTKEGLTRHALVEDVTVGSLKELMDVCIYVAITNKATTIVCPIKYTANGVDCVINADDVYAAQLHHECDIKFVDQSYIDQCIEDEKNDLQYEYDLDHKEEEEEMNNDNKEKARCFDMFDKWVNDATPVLDKYLTKVESLSLLNAKDSEVYAMLRQLTVKAGMRMMLSKKTKKDGVDMVNSVEELDATVEEATKMGIVMDKIKAFIALCFRTAMAVIKGSALFIFDATTIVGTLVGRVAYHTVREVVFASKAIVDAFKNDVIANVK